MGLPSLYMDFLLDFILCFLGVKEHRGGMGLMKSLPRASLIVRASKQLRASQSLRAPVVLSGWE